MSAEKFRDACIAYALAWAEIKQCKSDIGLHLGRCWGEQNERFMAAAPTPTMYGYIPEQDTVSHLELAYQCDRGEDEFGREVSYYANHDGDVAGYLAEHCQHCLAAHNSIQQRKAARKRFGIAKRRITVIGRAAATGGQT